ncbi:glycosyltransferase family 4 protein [Arthrobacter sp. DNA4]|uniref:glycosyltransferase family 4 protein n=1 Tax=Micrococcaceae TaxID=1268 RepID=UPI0020CF25EE|nr:MULTISPECIES: glycosyltransferase family 4 protein [Micrococcaceae]UTT68797.1 glycosyltransferase family 4 protein [Arthrobacter sp. DNA4]WRT13045.1 glycosyltransferase family 4 protein [Pseudarthrobacter sp. LT1]
MVNFVKVKRPLIVILQAYIPSYRVKFFEELIAKAHSVGIDIVVAAGEPSGNMAHRKDSVQPPFVVPVKQKELKAFGRRVALRLWPRIARHADLVVLEQARRNLDIYRLLVPKRLRRTNIALWGHGGDYAGSVGSLDEFLRRILTRESDWFFAYTSEGIRSVLRQGVDAKRATELKNSTDTTQLLKDLEAVNGSKRAAYRRLHSLGDKTAVYVGGLDAGKRINMLIEAGAEIVKHVPEFKLIIAGDGSSKTAVQEAAARYPWLLYAGAVTGEEKALILSSAAILTIPGSIGLVAVDSLIAGVPIVTTDDNRHGPEFAYLDPGKTVEVSACNTAAYATAVISVMNDRARLEAMRDSCIAASRGYSIEHMADNFLGGIREFLSAGGRRA